MKLAKFFTLLFLIAASMPLEAVKPKKASTSGVKEPPSPPNAFRVDMKEALTKRKQAYKADKAKKKQLIAQLKSDNPAVKLGLDQELIDMGLQHIKMYLGVALRENFMDFANESRLRFLERLGRETVIPYESLTRDDLGVLWSFYLDQNSNKPRSRAGFLAFALQVAGINEVPYKLIEKVVALCESPAKEATLPAWIGPRGPKGPISYTITIPFAISNELSIFKTLAKYFRVLKPAPKPVPVSEQDLATRDMLIAEALGDHPFAGEILEMIRNNDNVDLELLRAFVDNDAVVETIIQILNGFKSQQETSTRNVGNDQEDQDPISKWLATNPQSWYRTLVLAITNPELMPQNVLFSEIPKSLKEKLVGDLTVAGKTCLHTGHKIKYLIAARLIDISYPEKLVHDAARRLEMDDEGVVSKLVLEDFVTISGEYLHMSEKVVNDVFREFYGEFPRDFKLKIGTNDIESAYNQAAEALTEFRKKKISS